MRGIGSLLQEHGIARYFTDIDRDREALTGEDCVHDGDVLVGEIAGDGEDEYAWIQWRLRRFGTGEIGAFGAVGGGRSEGDGGLVYVR